MTQSVHPEGSPRRGAIEGLLAAALFGLATPLSKRLLVEVSPQVLAGLLYLGAGVGLVGYRVASPSIAEARLRRADLGKLCGVVLLGGVLGPVLMLLGLTRVTALAGSLLLNLEAPFTILVAVWLFRDHLDRRAGLAAAAIVAGAALLQLEHGAVGAAPLGPILIAGACMCWAIDNNLTQRLTLRDPIAVVRIKTLAAGAFNLALGLALGGGLPSLRACAGALALGSVSYGASVVLAAYAMRRVGAAREAAYFATGPFAGALASTVILGERLQAFHLLAMVVMAAGVVLLLRERHSHLHVHEALEHDHVHVHDEHHQHVHSPEDPPGEPHSHPHRHEPLVHDHPHVPDLHHRHSH